MNLNKVMLIGNLTRDPEIKTTPSGQTVATFSLATNLIWTDQSGQRQEKVEFHNLVAWRKLADICGHYLHKGSKIYAEGRLQTRDWTGQDGMKRNRTEIILENMIMLDRQNASGTGFSPASPAASNAMPTIEEPAPSDDEIRVENIPF